MIGARSTRCTGYGKLMRRMKTSPRHLPIFISSRFSTARRCRNLNGHWWLAFCEGTPVAFAGLVPSTDAENAGYFCRVGVLQAHWGRALQLRFMRAVEARARLNGWASICLRHHGQYPLGQQFHQGWLPALLAILSLGMAAHSILAEDNQSRQPPMRLQCLDCGLLGLACLIVPKPGGHVPPGSFCFEVCACRIATVVCIRLLPLVVRCE
jgi:hypothetical protein